MDLCAGKFKCVRCGREGGEMTQHPETRALDAYCWTCVSKLPEDEKRQMREHKVLYSKPALDVEKRLIKQITLHKLDGAADRRGFIVSAYFDPEVKNLAWGFASAVEIFQYCYMLVGNHYAIHKLGATGEQADCWINFDHHHAGPRVYLNHKYWGQAQIDAFVDILLILARVHGWKVDDERVPLLERIALAAAQDD